jgi:NADPH:quinone reductase-like Zn-dependent oxidoreductase
LGGFGADDFEDGSWAGVPLKFPLVQGADCCGRIVAVGDGVDSRSIGQRVMVRSMSDPTGTGAGTFTFGSECNGGFAEYTKAASRDAVAVDSTLTDLELATFPCAYSTAEGMIQRAKMGAERVLITGASGGVGSAAVQLAKRRGAHVTAITTPQKAPDLRTLGADDTLGRDDPYPTQSFDVILDLVGGSRWPDLLDALVSLGRYVTSGAIAGPVVELDLRTLYLRDLTLLGSTNQPDSIFTDLVSYIEAGEIKPMIAATFPLKDLAAAQEAFSTKAHIGKIAIDVAEN